MNKHMFKQRPISGTISALLVGMASLAPFSGAQATFDIQNAVEVKSGQKITASCAGCHSGAPVITTVKPNYLAAWQKAGGSPSLPPNSAAVAALADVIFPGSGGTPAAGPNTKPVISLVATEWNTDVGTLLSIPLSVTDAEHDGFTISGKPLPPEAHIVDGEDHAGLPTKYFQWTPVAGEANKIVTIAFVAKETRATKPLSSKPFAVKIHVWPAGDHANVSKLVISTAKWSADSLTLKGKVVLNAKMLPNEKTEYLKKPDTVKFVEGINHKGIAVGTSDTIHFDPKGNWELTPLALPATPAFSCSVTLQIGAGVPTTKKIAGAPKGCL